MTKKHNKTAPQIIAEHKRENAPNPVKRAARNKHTHHRNVAYLIHERLQLTFGQCVQLLMTQYELGHLIANKRIEAMNKVRSKNGEVEITLFDQENFNRLLTKSVAWANNVGDA